MAVVAVAVALVLMLGLVCGWNIVRATITIVCAIIAFFIVAHNSNHYVDDLRTYDG